MRRGNNGEMVFDGKGRLAMVSLGADYCSEHEWGIKGIKEKFGLPLELTRENAGKTFRTISRLPETTRSDTSWFKRLYVHDFVMDVRNTTTRRNRKVKTSALLFYPDVDQKAFTEEWRGRPPGELVPYVDDFRMVTAWSEGDFGLLVKGDERHIVDDLLEAFKRLDVCIWLGGGGVFKNAGLCLGIASRMPEEAFVQWKSVDDDALDIKDEDTKIGIRERLKEAGRGFFACHPGWKLISRVSDEKNIDTKYRLMYFLNPCEQRENRSGWFTVEELEQWIDGKGPVVKVSNDD